MTARPFRGVPLARLRALACQADALLDVVLRTDDGLLARERELVAKLTASWEVNFDAAQSVAERVIREGGDLAELLTEGDVDSVVEALGPVLTAGWEDAIADPVEAALRATYAIGRERVTKSLHLDVDWNATDERAQQALVDDTMYWVGDAWDNHLGDQIATVIRTECIEQGLSRREAAATLESIFAEQFPERSRAYWNVVAAAGCVRSRTFGTIGSFEQAEVETYEWLAIGDARTCRICAHLNGRVFRVESAVALRDRWMAAKTPEQAKEAHPWPCEKAVTSLDTAGLEAAGHVAPPIHGLDRCVLVPRKFRGEEDRPEAPASPAPAPAPPGASGPGEAGDANDLVTVTLPGGEPSPGTPIPPPEESDRG